MKQSSMTLAAGLTGALAGLPGRQVLGSSQKNHPGTSGEKKRPNVVFILSDDHRWDVMSCMGNPYIKTPNLDRLAQQGVMFENAFVNSAVCSPSRGSIFTGKYPHECAAPGIVYTNNSFLEQEKPFPTLLHATGYRTAHIGKWHLGKGDQPKPGYDYWAGFNWLGEFFDTKVWINGEEHQFEGYSDDILSRLAAEYILENSGSAQPYFLFLGLKAPHMPLTYPPRYADALADVEIPKPISYDEDYKDSGKPPEMENCLIRIETYPGGLPLFDHSWDKYVKSYYRAVMAIDDAVGTVMEAVDKSGAAEDTIIIYMTDNGYSLGDHGLTEKHFAYEGCIRTPMLMRYPRLVKPGIRRSEMVLNMDIAPTVLDLCDAPIPADMRGLSLCPLLESEYKPAGNWRGDFFIQLFGAGPQPVPVQIAVRTERYKLIRYPYHPYQELYDLGKDPHEMKNLIGDSRYTAVREEMEGRLDRLIRETGWVRYGYLPFQSCWVLGPVDSTDVPLVIDDVLSTPYDVEGRSIEMDNRTLLWQRIEHNEEDGLRIGEMLSDDPNKVAFIALPIERLIDRDPYTSLNCSPYFPFKAAINGRFFFETHDPRTPPLNPCNPPLMDSRNLLILQIEADDMQESVAFSLTAPEGSVKLP